MRMVGSGEEDQEAGLAHGAGSIQVAEIGREGGPLASLTGRG
jgi:hypothetical protein